MGRIQFDLKLKNPIEEGLRWVVERFEGRVDQVFHRRMHKIGQAVGSPV